ncbi:hypothetical protein M501DRAFT_1020927 [Patellaria atrata CBS 101060]|uniref:Zn(2)-C6 fungal-type domain-containing protein n=1 Tax=Patellaria atrata CBS 101060 TaxID=1346257 RepID=A0A9P4S108_9PEZI|nr:hypothetical protein M501DRAFT_1020927 [Patellaria atrata CBS 101060]
MVRVYSAVADKDTSYTSHNARRLAKSRNGCLHCKDKRLKCDETKPSCTNCLTRDITCPGYKKSLKWSTKYELLTSYPESQRSPFRGIRDEREVAGSSFPHPSVAEAFRIAEGSMTGNFAANSNIGPNTGTRCLPAHNNRYIPPKEIHADNDSSNSNGSKGYVDQLKADMRARTDASDWHIPASGIRFDPRRPLHGPGTNLVEHYFKEVCIVFSSYDGTLNPFRVSVGQIWQETPSIYYAIQSMAAAQLANIFPHMKLRGLKLQQSAYSCLYEELRRVETEKQPNDRILLAILLLGLSAAWHDCRDLGLAHLHAARNLIYPKLTRIGPQTKKTTQRHNQFFKESLIYWEMLLGFVSQESCTYVWDPWLGVGNLSRCKDSNEPKDKILPHPWTGVCPRTQMLFAEVGRLVRQQRLNRNRACDYISLNDDVELVWATALEQQLLELELPTLDDLIDPGDENTAKKHFITIGEAYRCAGLLEIYRIFPQILRQRLGSGSEIDERRCTYGLPQFAPDCNDSPLDMQIWVNSFAIYILKTLESLPLSSGTCCLQPILLVTASSELRYVASLDYYDFHANDSKVSYARRFVEGRLREFCRKLPAEPLRQMLVLIKEVWRRLDNGEEDVFWINVMFDNHWQTIMG